MTKRPVEKQEAISAFYAERAVDVSYYSALWHTFNVGHLMATDLERLCQKHALSFADLHLLSAIRVEGLNKQRATDLAQLLNVSNAVLSTRTRKLEQKGLLTRTPVENDRRAVELKLTSLGERICDAVGADIAEQANFVRCFRRLSAEDQNALARIMGELHNELDREFISTKRGE
ncbi:MAG: MarR family transcriptional regulator [Spongiibacteraceae bacterium]